MREKRYKIKENGIERNNDNHTNNKNMLDVFKVVCQSMGKEYLRHLLNLISHRQNHHRDEESCLFFQELVLKQAIS